MSALPKPRLRGLAIREYSIWLYGSLGVCGLFALWFKKNVVEARKKQYKEFYENWDDDKHFEAMKKAGVFKGFERP